MFAFAGMVVLGLARSAVGQAPSLPAHPIDVVTPVGVLTQPIDPAAPNADQLRLGQQLVAAGDCMSCHLR
jgi:hypothetical protein